MTGAAEAMPVSDRAARVALPSLRRLLRRLRARAGCGLAAQSLVLGAGAAVLAWGLATGLLRSDGWAAWAWLPGLVTAGAWWARGQRRLAALEVLTQAERHLDLHELWSTAWTLPPEGLAAAGAPGTPGTLGMPGTT
ncbi:MAG: hypothetical protein ACREJ2_16125, partial [Planctomycetota bacterium]